MSESATPESGALSFDQAVSSLLPQAQPEPDTQDAPEAPLEAAEEPPETEGETSAPEDPDAEPAELAADAEAEAEEAAVEPAEPPKYWSKDAKEAFGQLPPELQAVVLAQEGPREAAAAKVKAEAAEKAQRADAEMAKVQQFAESLGGKLEHWVQTFESRWAGGNPDWVAYAQEYGAEAMTLAKAQFEQEARQLAEAAQAKRHADAQAFEAYVKAESTKLQAIEPELADAEKGPERRAAVAQFLTKQGVPQEALRNISAVEMSMAYDAMRWRDAQAKLKAGPKPKPLAPAQRAPVRPAAAQAQTPSQRAATSVQNRFNAKPDIDNAVALLLNKRA